MVASHLQEEAAMRRFKNWINGWSDWVAGMFVVSAATGTGKAESYDDSWEGVADAWDDAADAWKRVGR